MEYIEITLTYNSIIVTYNGKEYILPITDYLIDYCSDTDYIIREESEIPLQRGKEVWRFPRCQTIIHHIAA